MKDYGKHIPTDEDTMKEFETGLDGPDAFETNDTLLEGGVEQLHAGTFDTNAINVTLGEPQDMEALSEFYAESGEDVGNLVSEAAIMEDEYNCPPKKKPIMATLSDVDKIMVTMGECLTMLYKRKLHENMGNNISNQTFEFLVVHAANIARDKIGAN